jgi:hypothetical protein
VATRAFPGYKLQYMFVNKSDVPVWLYVVDWCPFDTARPVVIHPRPVPRKSAPPVPTPSERLIECRPLECVLPFRSFGLSGLVETLPEEMRSQKRKMSFLVTFARAFDLCMPLGVGRRWLEFSHTFDVIVVDPNQQGRQHHHHAHHHPPHQSQHASAPPLAPNHQTQPYRPSSATPPASGMRPGHEP